MEPQSQREAVQLSHVTDLVAHRLRFRCVATTTLVLPPVSGPLVRGTLLATLLARFCPVHGSQQCGTPVFAAACPICPLLATMDEQHAKPTAPLAVAHTPVVTSKMGTPRPFVIESPPGRRTLTVGETFEFDLTIFGDPLPLLPYLVLGAAQMGARGFGDGRHAPGRFTLDGVDELDPIHGEQQCIMDIANERIAMPALPITHDGVLERARRLSGGAVTLELLTPLRLVADSKLVRQLGFDPLLRRLLRRIDALSLATTGQGLAIPFEDVIATAGDIRVQHDDTRWLDVNSYSSRTGRSMPIGGLVGTISFEGDLSPVLPWLVWGEIVHAGKDTTKGNGWYQLR